MKRDFIIPGVLLIPAIFIQILLIPSISLEGIFPDLVLILVVYFTLRTGQLFGTIYGFAAGFALDLLSGGLLGSSMFSKTLCGFVSGYFYNENKVLINLKTYKLPLIILMAGLINSLSMYFISGFDVKMNMVDVLISRGLLPAIYSAFIGSFAMFFHTGRVLE